MKISTKGRYALRVILDIAKYQQTEHGKFNRNVPVKKMAERQDLSIKYLEVIMQRLNAAGLVRSERGKFGGYQLTKEPWEIRVYDVLLAAEGSLSIVSCVEEEKCKRNEECRTVDFWVALQTHVMEYLQAVTIQDIINGNSNPVLTCLFHKRDTTKRPETIEERCTYGDL